MKMMSNILLVGVLQIIGWYGSGYVHIASMASQWYELGTYSVILYVMVRWLDDFGS